jgi:thiamine transport system substrate-binding protein
VFAPFEQAHHVSIELECPSGNLASTLIAQKNAPGADLVIGLDEITASEADSQGVLIPYVPPTLANVSPELVAALSPDHAATPYEWGYLGIDYNTTFAASINGTIDDSAFPAFAANASWAHQLLIEDPVTDITGEEFLVWEVEFYEQVEHSSNWQAWWQAVDPHVQVAPDWGTAFDEFTTPGGPAMVVSYTTDPAYAAYSGSPGAFNSTVSTVNGSAYGWETIYGIGIVAGTQHLTLDQQFVDWFLSGRVQAEIPTNEWEYPANQTVPLPAVYAAALDPRSVVPLNAAVNATTLYSSLSSTWLPQWQELFNTYG